MEKDRFITETCEMLSQLSALITASVQNVRTHLCIYQVKLESRDGQS